MHLGSANDDFQVDEIPAYAASGEGEHLHLRLRKRNLTTPLLISAVARACGVKERDVGYAGRKDRHALTEQDLTVYRGDEAGLSRLAEFIPADAQVEIVSSNRHRNKLRIGHLQGNRFRLRICAVENIETLNSALSAAMVRGIANCYGPQRYGRDGNNLQRAQDLAAGRCGSPRQRHLLGYWADAGQAAIFDAVIQARQQAGLLQQLRIGDVAMLANGAAFVVSAEDHNEAQQRLQRGELYCSGPLPGDRLLHAAEACDADEQLWSQAVALPWQAFAKGGPLPSSGGRRNAVVRFLEAPQLLPDIDGDQSCWLQFALTSGSYATTVCAALNIDCSQRGSMDQGA